MTHQATKLTIVTEKLLLKEIARIIDAAGATGYTVTPAGGKGSRNVRSSGGPTVSDPFNNIKIEVITSDPEMAERISNEIASKYFANYSGITYRDPVEVLHAQGFSPGL